MVAKKLTETKDSADQIVVPGDHVIFALPGEKKRLAPGRVKNITPTGQIRVVYTREPRWPADKAKECEMVSNCFLKDPRFDFQLASAGGGKYVPLPKFEGYAPEIVRELQAAFTMAVHNEGFHVTENDIPLVDLTVANMESLKAAAAESNWIPPQYMMNEVMADLCKFLREGPKAFMPSAD